MKTLKELAFMAIVVIFVSGCSQEHDLNGSAPSYHEVANSQSFKAFIAHVDKEIQLLDQYAVFDQETVYHSEKEKLEAIDKTVQNARLKAEILQRISAFRKQENLAAFSNEEALAKTIQFIKDQEVDLKIQENMIALIEHISSGDRKELVDGIFNTFPLITKEKLSEITSAYRNSPETP